VNLKTLRAASLPSLILLVACCSASHAVESDDARPLVSVTSAIAMLDSDDSAEQELGAKALATHAEAGDEAAIEALIGLLAGSPSKIQYQADWGLARTGALAVPALREAFARESNDAHRARIAFTLGRIGFDARPAAPELMVALEDPHSATGIRAAYALGAMRVRDALPLLVRAYASVRKISSQREIARAIDAIGSDQSARQARDSLIDSLDSDLASTDDQVRSEAIAYTVELLRVAHDRAPESLPTLEALVVLVPRLVSALDDPQSDTLAIVRGLGYAGASAASAVPHLQRLLQDPSLENEAARALTAIATPEAQRILADRASLAALEKRIRKEYSLFDHLGRMRLLPFYVIGQGANGLRMETRFLYTGDEVRRPTHVIIGFERYSPEARLTSLDAIECRTDGDEKIAMDDVDHTLGSSSQGVIERVSAILPVERFEVLASSNRIECRLASLDFKLVSEDRAALRHFAGKIPPVAPASQTH
jgi:HEAT repeat protein